MSFGAGLGLGLFGLFSLITLLGSDELTSGGLILRLLLLAGFIWAWSSFQGFREDLVDANRSGRILAWITVFISGAAVFLSAALFFL